MSPNYINVLIIIVIQRIHTKFSIEFSQEVFSSITSFMNFNSGKLFVFPPPEGRFERFSFMST